MLKIIDGKPAVTVDLEEEQPGCAAAYPKDLLKSHSLNLTQERAWIDVRMVSAKKAYFYKTPNQKGKRKAYLVYGDPIFVTTREQGWVHAEFVGELKNTTGWLREQDLFAKFK